MPQGPPLRQAARAFRHNSGRLCGKPHDAAQPRTFRPTRAACRKGPAPHGSQRNFWPRAPLPQTKNQTSATACGDILSGPAPGMPTPGPRPRARAPGPGPGPRPRAQGMRGKAKECQGMPGSGRAGGPGRRSGLRPRRKRTAAKPHAFFADVHSLQESAHEKGVSPTRLSSLAGGGGCTLWNSAPAGHAKQKKEATS